MKLQEGYKRSMDLLKAILFQSETYLETTGRYYSSLNDLTKKGRIDNRYFSARCWGTACLLQFGGNVHLQGHFRGQTGITDDFMYLSWRNTFAGIWQTRHKHHHCDIAWNSRSQNSASTNEEWLIIWVVAQNTTWPLN